MDDFEQLGSFYLGKRYDIDARQLCPELVLYDSKDLLTHAVCIGMTGSGKTGLCLTLLEEAAIDGIPALVIDPKGDLANILLTFPDLSPASFEPWVNPEDATRAGLSVGDFAAREAQRWRTGLAEWGQSPERIARMRAAVDIAVYTPGGTAGRSLSVLRSFDAPDAKLAEDAELWRQRVAGAASSLLGLLDVAADPLQSREHILISLILDTAWRAGQAVDLPRLVEQIQRPPVDRVGAVDLESFFPANERFALAMRLNNLLASPGFQAWLEGEPLDVGRLLRTTEGKPRITILSIAHLSDTERMFFVSLLLNQTLAWMRSQSGTTSLRAILYMDEIAGYFPPVANPPSKPPLLMLLKQARAFGLGVLLATQNPIDLDYKGLTNAGTWFIGRLQTERDKARLMDGLEGIAASGGAAVDRARLDQLLSALTNRVFLLNNVHEDGPVVFQVRWALSYLRGPLSRDEIKRLTASASITSTNSAAAAAGSSIATAAVGGAATIASLAKPDEPSRSQAGSAQRSASAGAARPLLPPDVPQFFAPCTGALVAATKCYRPRLWGLGTVRYRDAKLGIEVAEPWSATVDFPTAAGSIDWTAAETVDWQAGDLADVPTEPAQFSAPPASASSVRNYASWKKSLAEWLYANRRLTLSTSKRSKLVSRPDEADTEFRLRVEQALREERDRQVETLRARYAPKVAAMEERKRKAQQAVETQRDQASSATLANVISIGTTIVGALLGRKKISATTLSRAATSAKGVGRSRKESQDVARAEENVTAIEEQQTSLEREMEAATAELQNTWRTTTDDLEPLPVKPKKADITVERVALVWVPESA